MSNIWPPEAGKTSLKARIWRALQDSGSCRNPRECLPPQGIVSFRHEERCTRRVAILGRFSIPYGSAALAIVNVGRMRGPGVRCDWVPVALAVFTGESGDHPSLLRLNS